MPVYNYQCSNCKFRFELRQTFKDEPRATCPACDATASRIFSPVPILFKGPGFYVTDSRIEEERKRPVAKTADGKEDEGGAKP